MTAGRRCRDPHHTGVLHPRQNGMAGSYRTASERRFYAADRVLPTVAESRALRGAAWWPARRWTDGYRRYGQHKAKDAVTGGQGGDAADQAIDQVAEQAKQATPDQVDPMIDKAADATKDKI